MNKKNTAISGLGGARLRQRRNNDDNWLKNIYQLKKRFKILFKWCESKNISDVSIMIVLDDLMNGKLDEFTLKERVENNIT